MLMTLGQRGRIFECRAISTRNRYRRSSFDDEREANSRCWYQQRRRDGKAGGDLGSLLEERSAVPERRFVNGPRTRNRGARDIRTSAGSRATVRGRRFASGSL